MNATEWIESRSGLTLRPWQRATVLAMFPEDGSPSPWETFLISTIKKSGKSTLTAWCVLYAALHWPDGETAYMLGSDLEQAEETSFDLIAAAVREAGLVASGAATIQRDRIIFETGTRIIALPQDFAGSAGSRFGITAWTEAWTFRHESHVRLWEELTPIPNRRSLRIVDSYAGFDGDAPVLEPIWQRALAGQRLSDDLPIFANGRLWAFIDQGEEAQRRGWLGDPAEMESYYAEQRASLRPGSFNRLHLNQWQSGEEAFVTASAWDACEVAERPPAGPGPVFLGLDAATKHDSAAVVAVTATASAFGSSRIESGPPGSAARSTLSTSRSTSPSWRAASRSPPCSSTRTSSPARPGSCAGRGADGGAAPDVPATSPRRGRASTT